MEKKNIIKEKSFLFAIEIVGLYKVLAERKEFVLSRQMLRSGTSIGANIKEAQNAESKGDFIHKLKISLKEADETEYWLFLCENLENYPNPKELIEKLNGIIKMLNKIK